MAVELTCRDEQPIPEDISFEPLRDGLARQGGRLLVSLLRDMLAGKAKSITQGDADGLPKASPITAETAIVDFRTMTAQDIMNRHRAISHQVRMPVIYLFIRGLKDPAPAGTCYLSSLQKSDATSLPVNLHASPQPATPSH